MLCGGMCSSLAGVCRTNIDRWLNAREGPYHMITLPHYTGAHTFRVFCMNNIYLVVLGASAVGVGIVQGVFLLKVAGEASLRFFEKV